MSRPEDMWQCQTLNCGYIYDPDKGDRKGKIPKGTKFEDLPDDWRCPVCGAGKKMFRPLAGPGSVLEEQRAGDSERTAGQAAPVGKKSGAVAEESAVKRYVCSVCGYVYDPEVGDPDGGIAPGTPFEKIPDDWVCPVCGASKDQFEPE